MVKCGNQLAQLADGAHLGYQVQVQDNLREFLDRLRRPIPLPVLQLGILGSGFVHDDLGADGARPTVGYQPVSEHGPGPGPGLFVFDFLLQHLLQVKVCALQKAQRCDVGRVRFDFLAQVPGLFDLHDHPVVDGKGVGADGVVCTIRQHVGTAQLVHLVLLGDDARRHLKRLTVIIQGKDGYHGHVAEFVLDRVILLLVALNHALHLTVEQLAALGHVTFVPGQSSDLSVGNLGIAKVVLGTILQAKA